MSLVDSYSESNYNADRQILGWHPSTTSEMSAVGQSFTGNDKTITSAKFYLGTTGTPYGAAWAELYAHNGAYGSGTPGTLLEQSAVVWLPYDSAITLTDFTFSGGTLLEAGVNYYIVIVVDYYFFDTSNFAFVGIDNTAPSHGGNESYFANSTWNATSNDVIFYVYGNVLPIMTTTFIVLENISPLSGISPLVMSFSGYLTTVAGTKSMNTDLNGETINLQVWDSVNLVYINIGTTTTRVDNDGYSGYFNATAHWSPQTVMTYSLHNHYSGSGPKYFRSADSFVLSYVDITEVIPGTEVLLGTHTFSVGPSARKTMQLNLGIVEIPDGVDEVHITGVQNKEIVLSVEEVSKSSMDDLNTQWVTEADIALNIPLFEEDKLCRIVDITYQEVAGVPELTYYDVTITVVLKEDES
jgi:hypothetical protein